MKRIIKDLGVSLGRITATYAAINWLLHMVDLSKEEQKEKEIVRMKDVYVVGAVDPDVGLFEFFVEKSKKEALDRIGELYNQYHNENSQTGILFVDKGSFKDKLPTKRMTSIEINEKIYVDVNGNVIDLKRR